MTRKGAWFATDDAIEWESAGEGIRRKVLCYESRVMAVRVEFSAAH